jgi:hypothetical protein
MVGDSPQSLIGNLSVADADYYFANRQVDGFNAVWINLLCNSYMFCNSDGTTVDGIAPFTTTGDLSTPNEAYFSKADQEVRLAAKHGRVEQSGCPVHDDFYKHSYYEIDHDGRQPQLRDRRARADTDSHHLLSDRVPLTLLSGRLRSQTRGERRRFIKRPITEIRSPSVGTNGAKRFVTQDLSLVTGLSCTRTPAGTPGANERKLCSIACKSQLLVVLL